MDKLKYVKLENEDGSYTSSIPLAVDSDYVNVNGNTLTNELNNKATKTEVQALASGTPLVASSTSDMTNTSKVYVNTTDGKWYYYDGNSWEIGGTYQATAIEDNSIIPKMLFETLQDSIKINSTSVLETEDTTFSKKKYVDGNGIVRSVDASLGVMSIDVSSKINQIFKLKEFFMVEWFGTSSGVPLYVILDSNNNVLDKVVKTTTGWFNVDIQIPANANTLLFNVNYGATHYGATLEQVSNYCQKQSIDYQQLDDKIKSLIKFKASSTNLASSFIPNCYFTVNGGQISAVNNYTIYKANVTPGKIYKIVGKQFYQNPIYGFCNNLTTRDITKNNITYTVGTFIETNTLYTSDGIYEEYVTIPSYCDHILLNSDYSGAPGVYEVTDYLLDGYIENKLKGKKIVYDGDSISESRLSGLAQNGGAYAKIIADITLGTYVNQSVGGGLLRSATAIESQNHSLVDNLSNLPTDGDLYCFEGGINDFWQNATLGTFIADDFTGTLDTTTVAGGLETIFRYALTNFVGKPIVFIIPHKIQQTAYRNNSAGNSFKDYRDMMVAICNKYSIPYYDAFYESGLNGWNTAQSNEYLTANQTGTADGCHPNENGYKKYYVPQLISLFNSLL